MAGGKETPRQKMIGMMYLVLTALLALQVSNQILQKFVLLNDGLERTSKNYIEKNAFMVNSIRSTVEQQGNNERDLPKVEAAREIREATSDIFAYLEGLKQELIDQTNAKNEDGTYKTSSLKNQDITGNIFNNNRKGYEMEERLNEFPVQIENVLASIGIEQNFDRIAKDAREIDLFKNDPNANYKDFVNLNFVKSPVGAVLALISQYQNEVLNIESEALSSITNSIGTFYFKSDVFEARVAASSNVVAAGTKFEGDMFIASASSSAMPKMTVDGREVPVEDGFGKISFTVPPASNYDDRGLAKKTLQGEITVNIAGKDSTLAVNYEYFVAKPVIRVESETVNQLYANSANVLMIDVPALGTSYAPSFTVSNGRAISGSRPGQVTIIPTSDSGKVTIGVSSGGNKIGDVEYDIKPVPAPTIRLHDNRGPIDLTSPYASPGPGTLLVKAIPEANFGRTMANDANFEVTAGEVRLIRNEVPRETVQISGETVGGINSLRQRAQPGDRFVVVVREVTRTNFQGNKIKTSLNEVYSFSIR
ncbi:gliding motility protein GldM [Litoribacter alkaliphilus]|uniref:Gliding motility protein GldM n=1 Tax=Litoribacter ruber TaxID=702568 RepID=A0AAP2CKH5_9BACT|nr:gliding motility protein GldM [Litoribacter alkaliphilus]MBS9524220.1 gliding motility protein GldM [Litoribacter alkaliphilus]